MNGPRIRRLALMLVLWLVSGCENIPVEDVEDIEDVEDVEDVVGAGARERWECGDRLSGCGLGRCPVTLTADSHSGTGTVEFAGTVNYARFEIRGLSRRWDWCPQADVRYGCAFVMDADGSGRYYDFIDVMPDADGTRRTKPSDLFKCMRRRERSA